MSKHHLIFTIPLILFSLAGCSSRRGTAPSTLSDTTRLHPRLKSLAWLSGNWISTTGERTLLESWGRMTDSSFGGHVRMIHEGDTSWIEHLALLIRHDTVYLMATVMRQNNRKPVYFRFTGESRGEFSFENPDHDFPQRIFYAHPSANEMYARIEGVIDGSPEKEEFHYTKDPNAAVTTFREMISRDPAQLKTTRR